MLPLPEWIQLEKEIEGSLPTPSLSLHKFTNGCVIAIYYNTRLGRGFARSDLTDVGVFEDFF